MKAIVCEAFGKVEELKVRDVPATNPGPGEVSIDVHYAGLNFPDLLLVQGLYQQKPKLPFTPGAEVSGHVRAVGEGVTDLQVGDKVVAQMRTGGYAEQVVVPRLHCHRLAADADLKAAAGLLVTYGTAYHALKDRAQVVSGERIAVLGAAGGVGLATLDLARHLGLSSIACASTPEKLALCAQYGADAEILYAETDLKDTLKAIGGRKGIDVIMDPVGGPYAEAALRSLAYNGRYLVVGFTSGQIPRIPLNLPLLKVCSIVGVFWGRFMQEQHAIARQNHQQLAQWYSDEHLKPYVQRTFPLEEAVAAMHWIGARKAMGKVCLAIKD